MHSSYPRNAGQDLIAYVATTGTIVKPAPRAGLTLASSTTYYLAVPTTREALASLHFKWDAVLNAVITFETSNFPEDDAPWDNPDRGDVSVYDTTTGNWIQQDPSTAYVPTTTTGVSVSSMTITVAGTNAGGAWLDLGNLGCVRARVKVVVTTGGVLRAAAWGKLV